MNGKIPGTVCCPSCLSFSRNDEPLVAEDEQLESETLSLIRFACGGMTFLTWYIGEDGHFMVKTKDVLVACPKRPS